MLRDGFSLGGEQSGHIIFTDYLFTGDGLATALGVLRVMAEHRPAAVVAGSAARDLSAGARERARARAARSGDGARDRATSSTDVESRLAGHGRLLVRYSGTEPLLRIMLEGRDQRRDRALGERDRSVS